MGVVCGSAGGGGGVLFLLWSSGDEYVFLVDVVFVDLHVTGQCEYDDIFVTVFDLIVDFIQYGSCCCHGR